MSKLMILPIGAGVIGQDDVPLVRIMDSDETPTTITVYGVVDTVQPVTAVTWTVNGVEQTGDVSRSPVLELTNLQPETNYAITLRATNINGESSASARTITTKKITTVTPNDVLSGISYYNQDVYYTGNIPTKDENDIVVNGRDVTVPTGYYAESETVSVSSDYIIPTGTKNITDNGNEDVTQYANVNVNVQPALYTPSNVTPTTSQQTITTPTGYYGLDSVTVDGVTSAIDANIQAGNIKDGVTILGVTGTFDPTPNLDTLNVTPSTSSQTLSPTGGIDGWDEVNVGPVGASIDSNIQAGNIKDGVVILGVTGTYDPQPNMTAINVVPTKQAQVITPTGGVDGFDEVNVSPVTALIDNNITPENIKKDVAILGVTGTFEGGIQPTGTLNIVNNGTYDITNYANVSVNVAAGDFNFICFTANEANCTVGMSHVGTNATATKPVMYYSTDKQTWNSWGGETITLANQNDKVYFYGDNNLQQFSYNLFNRSAFTTTGDLTLSGNLMTLITKYGDREKIPSSLCFYQLFARTSITDASNLVLPVTTLNQPRVYMEMFSGCTNLITPPELPATSLSEECYANMFNGCTNLQTIPNLPAISLAKRCYVGMFQNCTSISSIQNLPADSLGEECYSNMFDGCVNLTTVPSILPATSLVKKCYYQMFKGCTSLAAAPQLPGKQVADNCYTEMFNGCTLIDEIIISAETWNSSWSNNWLNNVAPSGTFVKPYALQTGSGTGQIPLDSASGIPSGWTTNDAALVSGDDNDYITLSISSGYDIYYTTDGTTPTTSSTLYTGPISVQGLGDTFTLKFISTDNNTFVSPVSEYTYYNMFYIEAAENNTVLNLQNWSQQYSSSGQKVAYSTDKKTWTSVPRNTTAYTLANTGDRVYFRKWTVNGDTWGQGSFSAVASGTIKIGGCLEYAVYWDITGNRPAEAGCENMFQSCTRLVDASKLVLFGSKYTSMFNACVDLVTPPATLPATTLTNSAYQGMFFGCTSMITAPTIMATGVCPDSACLNMFNGCTNLINPPTFNFTSFTGKYGLKQAFKGCTRITRAQELPALSLAEACYESMYEDCTSLTIAPYELPATQLVRECYSYMFKNCTNLRNAPVLKFTNFEINNFNPGAIKEMFSGCTNINRVRISTTNWLPNKTTDWLLNVAQTGTLIKPSSLVIGSGTYQMPPNSTSGLPSGWTAVDETNPTYPDMLHFTSGLPNSTVSMVSYVNGTKGSCNLTLYKSTDGINFSSWDGSTVRFDNIGDELWVYGVNQTISTDGFNWSQFEMSGEIAAAGDVTYLYQLGGLTTLPNDYALKKLFSGCYSLTSAPALPATTLTQYCYHNMFYNCTGLTAAPALPATTLAVECYFGMFENCGALTSAPTLSATTLANYCYDSMFKGCISLTQAPELPATTLTSYCYFNMFNGCTSLETSPALPAATLAPYCYWQMFKNCTSLNDIICTATNISASNCTTDWVSNVAATGTFHKHANMSNWTTGTNGIPSGWTIENEVDCSNCYNWSDCGYTSYDDCACQQYSENCINISNPTLTLVDDDGQGNKEYYFTIKCDSTTYQDIEGGELTLYDSYGNMVTLQNPDIDTYSSTYNKIVFNFTDDGTYYFDSDGGGFDINLENYGTIYSNGHWEYEDATTNCTGLTLPTVVNITIEEVNGDEWVERITLSDDLSGYDGYKISVYSSDAGGGFDISSNINENEGTYIGNNTFENTVSYDPSLNFGTYFDFEVDFLLGEFGECNGTLTGQEGDVVML